MKPTNQQIIDEIERGPMAAELAAHWNDVFQPPPGDDPPKPQNLADYDQWKATMSSREAKRRRAGWIKEDAAFAIHKLMEKRLEELDWQIGYKDIRNAQRDQVER